MTAIEKAMAWLPTKLSSDDDTRVGYDFGAKATLPLTQDTPVVLHDITQLCWFYVTVWKYQIHADTASFLLVTEVLADT